MGILLTSIALAAQCVMTPESIARFALLTGVLYLAGAWLCGWCVAIKFKARYHTPSACLASAFTLLGLFYFSQIQPNLGTRAYLLSLGLGALHALPFFSIIQSKVHKDQIDTYLYWCYLIFCIYTVLRPLALMVFEQLPLSQLAQSVYWFITLLGSILFSMSIGFLLLASSIRQTLRQLHNERDHDTLTQLLNRRAFEESVAKALVPAPQHPGTVMIVDIDHFKRINDTWGHDFGDQVLRNVGQCLRQSTRGSDLLGRYGGEEFVLLLPQTDAAQAQHIAQRMQQQLADAAMRLPDCSQLTMSVGISAMQSDESFYDALKRADHALYQAKDTGRNRICIADPANAQPLSRRTTDSHILPSRINATAKTARSLQHH